MAFKILITEGESPLGVGLLAAFENEKHSLLCPSMSVEDWCNESKIYAYLQDQNPAVLVNTLQFSEPSTSVSSAAMYQVLAKVCSQLDIAVIHLSSHQVFSHLQQHDSPMDETDGPKPDTDIGIMYLAAEQSFSEVARCISLRLPLVVDLPGGVLEQILSTLAYCGSIKVSEAWKGSFVSMDDVIRTVVAITQQILCDSKNWGVAHIRTSDKCTELEFVDYVQRVLDKAGYRSGSVHIVSTEDRFIRTNSWLGGVMCTNGFGIQFRSWRLGLKTKVMRWINSELSAKRLTLKEIS